MKADANELGRSLRQWRERVAPAAVGLPVNGSRRTPGLRREELAGLAGISVDYLTRLEQGRSLTPSAQVLVALARALRLAAAERDYLFRLAGPPLPEEGRIQAHLTPGVQRLLDRLDDAPVAVYDAGWTLLAWNPIWAALMGDASGWAGRERNLPWRHFVLGWGRSNAGRVLRPAAETEAFEAEMAADLRSAGARYPGDDGLARLITDLTAASARFAELWRAGGVATHTGDRKTIQHPEVGPLILDCDVLTVQGADLRIVAYTAESGSDAAQKLALLRVIGLQALSGA